VYVLVLLEARGGGKGLATLRAGVGSGTDVLRADVPLQVTGVCEHLLGKERGIQGGSLHTQPTDIRLWISTGFASGCRYCTQVNKSLYRFML